MPTPKRKPESVNRSKPETADRPLTPQQLRFVEEFIIDLNGTQAAIRAGYSAKTAQEQSSRLLSKAMVQEAIQAAQQQRSERVEITQDYVVTRLQGEAELKGKGSTHAARVRALELLGKHLSMFVERHQHGGDPNSPPIQHAHSKAEELTSEQRIERLRELAQRIQQRRLGVSDPGGTAGVGRNLNGSAQPG